jgi:hypothetical protein
LAALLSVAGREMLTREAEEVARLAMEAQQPCLEMCIRHLERALREAAGAGLPLLMPTAPSMPGESASGPATPQRLQHASTSDGCVELRGAMPCTSPDRSTPTVYPPKWRD